MLREVEELRLLDDDEDVARLDGFADLDGYAGDAAGFGGLEPVLHLHGFDDDEALLGGDFIAGCNEDADYAAGHGSFDGFRAVGACACAATGAEGARVVDGEGDALAVEEDGIAFGRGVEDAAELLGGWVEREERQEAGCEGADVDLDGAAVDEAGYFAGELSVAGWELYLAQAAVDF